MTVERFCAGGLSTGQQTFEGHSRLFFMGNPPGTGVLQRGQTRTGSGPC